MTAYFGRFTLVLAVALTVTATADPHQAGQAQAPALPSGSLTFGAVTAEFRPDGSFVAEASIQGVGVSRVTAQWKAEAGIVELVAWDSKAFPLLGRTAGCEMPGRYRYAVESGHVRFERVADDCVARRTLFDDTRWRPTGTPERIPERRIVSTPGKPRPAVPRAADAFGSWPSFRGPEASGVADGQALPDQWNVGTREHVLWKTPIPGLAHSSPIVWGDRLFVTSAISSRSGATLEAERLLHDARDASEDHSRQRWMLYALDRRTGQITWERTVHEGEPIDKRHFRSTYASATPATDGRVVVSWFGSHGVHAYTVTGDFLWKADVGRVDVGAPGFEWGPASSPIIWNDLVILQVDTQTDSFVVALALETGEQVWKTGRDEPSSWSTPTVVSTAGGPELITSGMNYFRGYDPRTGEERWRVRNGGGSVQQVVATSILGDGLFVLTSVGIGGGPRPLVVVRPGQRGDLSLKENETSNASVAWSRPARGSSKPTPIAYRGLLYVLASNGVLDAYDLKTGEEIYRQRLPAIGSGFSASPIAADGKLYFANEDGEIVVVSAGREFHNIATNTMGEMLMATPAMSQGVMYVRGLQSLFAIGAKP